MDQNPDLIQKTMEQKDMRLTEIFQMFYPLAVKIGEKYLVREDAKDVAQEAFCILYNKYDLNLPDAEIKALLLRITTTKAIDRIRRSKIEKRAFLDYHGGSFAIEKSGGYSLEKDLILQDLKQQILSEIRSMRPEWSDVLYLHIIMQFSQEEASEMMHIPVTALRARLNRARNFLRQKYGDDFEMFL